MKRLCGMLAALASALIMGSAVAADDEAARETYIYGTYFNCDVAGEDAADEVFKKRFAPAYEKALKDGMITGWGYLKHQTGGNWRRLTYHMASDVVDVIKASEAMGEMMNKEWKDEDDAFPTACHSHDDYIWMSKSGNVTDRRGKVGMSVYFECDMNREERADKIVEQAFAPVYDAHMGDGMLTSWGWLSHVVGGEYRRALTMTAANIEDLMATRAKILEADILASEEFISICRSHRDYIWDIAMGGR